MGTGVVTIEYTCLPSAACRKGLASRKQIRIGGEEQGVQETGTGARVGVGSGQVGMASGGNRTGKGTGTEQVAETGGRLDVEIEAETEFVDSGRR